MSDQVRDPQTGISMRFVKQWDIAKDKHPDRFDVFTTESEAALFLAAGDDRDVPFAEKLADALSFIREEKARTGTAIVNVPRPAEKGSPR